MNVLIVESQTELGRIWSAHLARNGSNVKLVSSQEQAVETILEFAPDIIILNLHLEDGSALAVSDFASYRSPQSRIIFVTHKTFFSDGSIFNLASNACAFVPAATPPEDLAAIVEHYGSDT